MGTGFRGTFVISWSQTSIDGLEAAPLSSLQVGVAWSWLGEAVRVDGPSQLLELVQADGETDIRRRAARMVRRLVGAAVTNTTRLDEVEVAHPLADTSFVVTDGRQSYTVTAIEVEGTAGPLLMFLDEIPPRGADLWVVHLALSHSARHADAEQTGGVICFTPGTRLRTPRGTILVEDLREGDLVQTKDNGAQEIQWIGSRRMSGARLYALPKLRPIRIRAGAFGLERPDEEFLVSPEHRMLLTGPVAQALFNTPEVLVAAKDLVNGRTVTRDLTVREVTYVHLLLPRHEVLFANGVETESFHPSNTALSTIREIDRLRLLAMLPEIQNNPQTYGCHARRNLSSTEAAILMHEAA
ncbi:Hint domain-containing protein [Salipiger sp. P9]|uniref:Hint domain-containing protein n=1 Tax=Salipiger pentaromativorans TaxID=2943193 RepID=UPI0021588AB1|nr:Hint domain-containing protein [Salipiger pentaromativorans]MCR8549114.1 Hint domain-containing protein [Salipiger pentaromativorans]